MQHIGMTPRALLAALTLGGCIGTIDGSGDDTGGDDGSGSGSAEPVVCEQARTYTNMGGQDLTFDRPTIAAGSDRLRIKPYKALAAEYNRALGLTDVDTAPYAGTFGKPPARWYEEPAASAATIYAAFALAYAACSRKTAAGGDFAMEPSPAIADRLCHDFARAAWQREPTGDELATCATYAVSPTHASQAPATRWAYTCAAVLSATSFITY